MSTHEGPGMSRTVARCDPRVTIGPERGISLGSIAKTNNAKTLVEAKRHQGHGRATAGTGEEVPGHKMPLRQELNVARICGWSSWGMIMKHLLM